VPKRLFPCWGGRGLKLDILSKKPQSVSMRNKKSSKKITRTHMHAEARTEEYLGRLVLSRASQGSWRDKDLAKKREGELSRKKNV